MQDFPAATFRIDGVPASIRASALNHWSAFGVAATDSSANIRSLDTSLFEGPEGDIYREGLNTSLPPHLETAGAAHLKVSCALQTLASDVDVLQTRIAPFAVRAPALWADLQAARGGLASAQEADAAHDKAIAAQQAVLKPDEAMPVDQYQPQSGTATTALSSAQQAWDECHGAAIQIQSDLKAAVTRCASTIREAAMMRFKKNPSGLGALVSGFKNFVKDHVAGLQKLSGVLKGVSAVAGLLSFVPVVGEVAAPIALAAGAGALMIDASVKYATGKGSWASIAVDAGLMAMPGVGRLAGRGISALRGAGGMTEDLIHARLAVHAASAQADFANGTLKLTRAQRLAAARNPSLLPAFQGQRLDLRMKMYVAKDPVLLDRGLQITKQGVKGPDFTNPVAQPHEASWYDLTTEKAWPAHQTRYQSYGQGKGIFWR